MRNGYFRTGSHRLLDVGSHGLEGLVGSVGLLTDAIQLLPLLVNVMEPTLLRGGHRILGLTETAVADKTGVEHRRAHLCIATNRANVRYPYAALTCR